jgi:hypothetical protein
VNATATAVDDAPEECEHMELRFYDRLPSDGKTEVYTCLQCGGYVMCVDLLLKGCTIWIRTYEFE